MAGGDWREMFAPRILHRGYEYYKDGMVRSVQDLGGLVRARVLGGELYSVEIAFEGGEVLAWRCGCPYAEDGTPCKHLAAVLYALDANKPAHEAEPIEDVVGSLDLPAARALLVRLAKSDGSAEEITRSAAALSIGELESVEKRIDEMLRRAAGRDGYIEYDAAWRVVNELERFVSDAAGRLLESGRVWESFQLCCHALMAAFGCDMDDTSGCLGILADSCFDHWRRQIGAAPPELEREMFHWLGDNYSSAPEYCGELFLEARRVLFEGVEYTRDNLRQADEMISAHKPEPGRDFTFEELLRRRISLMEELGASGEEIERFEEKYREQPFMRERIVGRLLKEGRFSEAEALLVEGKTLSAPRYGLADAYSERLIGLYERTGQAEKLRRELMFRVFECERPELEHIAKLKGLAAPAEWPELRERLLACRLGSELRGELLASEGLYERLLEYVISQNNLPALDRWEAALLPLYPRELRDAYTALIDELMSSSFDRQAYAHTIAHLKRLCKYPGRPDAELAERWKNEYPRRTAMLDELKKAGY